MTEKMPHLVPLPLRLLGRFVLWILGWQTVGNPRQVNKAVVIGAFHTSNWDAVIGLAAAFALDIRFRVMIKDMWFRFPIGILTRAIGGIPIDRSSPHNVVEQMIQIFDKYEYFLLLITPEGTRKKSPYWKTGFYHIAVGAKLPIMLAFFDYPTKRIGVKDIFYPSGNLEADMEIIRAAYADVTPKYPENAGEIRIKPSEGA